MGFETDSLQASIVLYLLDRQQLATKTALLYLRLECLRMMSYSRILPLTIVINAPVGSHFLMEALKGRRLKVVFQD